MTVTEEAEEKGKERKRDRKKERGSGRENKKENEKYGGRGQTKEDLRYGRRLTERRTTVFKTKPLAKPLSFFFSIKDRGNEDGQIGLRFCLMFSVLRC